MNRIQTIRTMRKFVLQAAAALFVIAAIAFASVCVTPGSYDSLVARGETSVVTTSTATVGVSTYENQSISGLIYASSPYYKNSTAFYEETASTTDSLVSYARVHHSDTLEERRDYYPQIITFVDDNINNAFNTSLVSANAKGATIREQGFCVLNGGSLGVETNYMPVTSNTAYANTTLFYSFKFSQDLVNVLKDRLLSVTVQPYVITAKSSGSTANDNAVIRVDLYNSIENKIYGLGRGTVTLNSMGGGLVKNGFGESRVSSGEYGEESFFQVAIGNWQGNDGLSQNITEVGVRLTVKPNTNVAIGFNYDDEDSITIKGTNRHPDAPATVATQGDEVSIKLKLYDSNYDIVLDKTKPASASAVTEYTNGTMFRRLFLTSEDDYLIDWNEPAYGSSGTTDKDYSGQEYNFIVEGEQDIVYSPVTYYRKRNGQKQTFGHTYEIKITVDGVGPDTPELASNLFLNKYLSNVGMDIMSDAFFTAVASQELLDPETKQPIRLNLCYRGTTEDTRPVLTDNSLDLKGGAPTLVYYRTTYIGENIPTESGDTFATRFNLTTGRRANDSSTVSVNDVDDGAYFGIFCTSKDKVKPVYNNMYIDLHNENGDILQSGVWAIELYSVDFVGNERMQSLRYFIKIDVNDYDFKIHYVLGENIGDDKDTKITTNEARLLYTLIDDAGEAGADKEIKSSDADMKITLRRGDKVRFAIEFVNQNNFNKYKFASFYSKQSNRIDCTDNEYTGYRTDALSPDEDYTFYVYDTYCLKDRAGNDEGEKYRYVLFSFKLQATIEVVNNDVIYSGKSAEIKPSVYYNREQVDASGVNVTYYYDSSFETPMSGAPVDAGTYYYVAKLNNRYYYAGASGRISIKQAVPDIVGTKNSGLHTSYYLNYGDSFALLDIGALALTPDRMLQTLANTKALGSDYFTALSDAQNELAKAFNPSALGSYAKGSGRYANELTAWLRKKLAVNDTTDVSGLTGRFYYAYIKELIVGKTAEPAVMALAEEFEKAYLAERKENFVYLELQNVLGAIYKKGILAGNKNLLGENYFDEATAEEIQKANAFKPSVLGEYALGGSEAKKLAARQRTWLLRILGADSGSIDYVMDNFYYAFLNSVAESLRFSEAQKAETERGYLAERISNVGSYSESGRTLNERLYLINEAGEVVYAMSYDGIIGYFRISESDRQQSYYDRPNAGVYRLTVEFVPVLGTVVSGNTVVFDYYRGDFIRNNNYDIATREITVTVRHDESISASLLPTSTGTIDPEDPDMITYVYSGRDVIAEYKVIGTRSDEFGIDLTEFTAALYARINSRDDDLSQVVFNDAIPNKAGLYAVRVVIDDSLCNYTSTEPIYWYIKIDKITLTVKADDSYFVYQKEGTPVCSAYHNGIERNDVSFAFRYYYYNSAYGVGLDAMAVEENSVADADMRMFAGERLMPVNVGNYVVAVDVVSENYDGTGYALYNITPVNNDSEGLNIKTWPMLYNNPLSPSCNLTYGQPLGDVRLGDTFTITYNYVVYYSKQNKTTNAQTLKGEVIVVSQKYDLWRTHRRNELTEDAYKEAIKSLTTAPSYAEWLNEETSREAYVDYMRKYDESEYLTDRYAYYYCLIVSGDDAKNFDFVYGDLPIAIGQAQLDWSRVVIDPVTYEDKISKVRNASATSDGVGVSETIGRLYSTKGIIPDGDENVDWYKNGNYVYRILKTGYEYYLDETFGTQTPSAGIVPIIINVTFRDENGDENHNYSSRTSSRCELHVNKKTLDVKFKYEDGYTSSYGLYDEKTLLNECFEYSGNTLPLAGVTGTFTYDGQTFDSVMPAGAYDVVYTVVNDNYDGSATFRLTIKKANLRVSTAPRIVNETSRVSYNARYCDVTFANGVMIGEAGETVSGRFRASSEYTDEVFGFAGMTTRILFEFVPDEADNYEIYDARNDDYAQNGFVTSTISRADVSRSMSLTVKKSYKYSDIRYLVSSDKTQDAFKEWLLIDNAITYSAGAYDGLAWRLGITNANNVSPSENALINAGVYTLRAYIDEQNYVGSVTATLVVEKKGAYLRVYQTENGQLVPVDGKGSVILQDGIYGVKKEYDGGAAGISVAVFDEEGNLIRETVTATYYKNNVIYKDTPGRIGWYDCRLSLDSSPNYKLIDEFDLNSELDYKETFLIVGVNRSELQFLSINQTYTMQKNVGVVLGINDAVYTLKFATQDGLTVYDKLPVNAGVYDIILEFDASENFGYSDRIIASEIDPSYVLTINKLGAVITVQSSVSVVYNGKQREPFTSYTTPYGLKLKYTLIDENGETTYELKELGALDAGEYTVKISIDDANHQGETTIRYTVTPAAITVTKTPVFKDYEYCGEIAPEIAVSGEAYCAADGSVVEGTFSIAIETVNTRNAGTHVVNYIFTPASGNYQQVGGTVNLTIVKKVLEDEFLYIRTVDNEFIGFSVMENSDYAVEYNTLTHSVEVSFDKNKIYMYGTVNDDFTVSVTYNESISKPREKGIYTIRARVLSKNYTCERVWEYKFVVAQGTPHIAEKPAVTKTFKVGDTIDGSTIRGGKAVVKATGTRIEGTFSVVSKTFDRANINKVDVKFSPDDTNLYKDVSFTIDVNVIGIDALTIGDEGALPEGSTRSGEDWTNYDGNLIATTKRISPAFTATNRRSACSGAVIKIVPADSSMTTVPYGTRISELKVTFVPCSDDCETCNNEIEIMNSCGVLKFTADKDYIPSVGEKVEVVYMLTVGAAENYEKYNYMYGEISTLGLITKVDIASYNDELLSFGSGEDKEYIYNVYDGDRHIVGAELKYVNGAYTVVALDGEIAMTDLVSETIAKVTVNGDEVYLEFTFKNYVVSGVTLTPSSFTIIAESDILVSDTEKTYDGNPIGIYDLGISVYSQLPVSDGSYYIKVYDENNNLTDGKSIGTYTIYLYVKDLVNRYYGVKKFSFEVTKRDVGADIRLIKTEDTFGEATASVMTVGIGDEVLSESAYTLLFKRENESDDAYASAIDFVAGVYYVKVTITASEYYTGSAVLKYTVNKRALVTVGLESNYRYTYGGTPPAITIGLKDKSSGASFGGGYTIYYYSDVYSKSSIAPTNAGTYSAVVEIDNQNYTLEGGAFEYTIIPRATYIKETPGFIYETKDGESYNLKYGQRFGELSFDGTGVGCYNDVPVAGKFVVDSAYASLVPNAGEVAVKVLFVPDDTNYSSASAEIKVKVAKAVATITFTELSAYYDGTNKRNSIKYFTTPSVNVTIRFKGVNGISDAPINADNYELIVTTDNPNYTVKTALTQDGTAPIFSIYKAQVRQVFVPTAVPVKVGESLLKSSLNDGRVYYEGFNAPVQGEFSFVRNALIFTEADVKQVEFVFTPTDRANFATTKGVVDIVIEKGLATIKVSGNTIEYGTPADFSKIIFSTDPTALSDKVKLDCTYNGVTYNDGEILKAGVYYFSCYVDDDNYSSERFVFAYEVLKKEIDVDFVDETGNVVTTYSVKYAKSIKIGIKLYDANDTSGKRTYLIKDADTVASNVVYTYYKDGQPLEYTPTEIGSYDLKVTLYHANYTAEKTVYYRIQIGTIESIDFDENSLFNQVYGSVTAPIISVTPHDASYYVIYQGHEKNLPTEAGTYNITVYIDDPNYESTQKSAVFRINPKSIELTDLFVKDKVYDGNSVLEIDGRLSGILFKDEVFVTLKARTFNGDPSVGEHYVEILSYELSGLKSSDYVLSKPTYEKKVTILNNVIRAEDGGSYVLSTKNGFKQGTKVSFFNVDLKANKSNIFTRMVGVDTKVIGYTITLNDSDTINADQYKVCVEIPEEFRNKKFTVKFAGGLDGDSLSPKTEGNYISFYASSTTGQIVFEVAEMQYTYVVIAGVLLIILIAVIVLFILNPLVSRRKVSDPGTEKRAIRNIKKG